MKVASASLVMATGKFSFKLTCTSGGGAAGADEVLVDEQELKRVSEIRLAIVIHKNILCFDFESEV